MDIRTAIRARLKADPAIAAIVAGRVYGPAAPQASPFPRLRLQMSGGGDVEALNVVTVGRARTIQVRADGDDYGLLIELMAAVEACLRIVDQVVGGLYVARISAGDEQDVPAAPAGGQGQTLHSIVQDFEITFKRQG